MFTPKQIEALKYLLSHAEIKNDLAKRIVFFLLEKSNGLTQEVAFSLFEGRSGYSAEDVRTAARSVDYLRSVHGTTHIDAVFAAMNAEMHFSIHYGHYAENDPNSYNTLGQFPGFKHHPVDAPVRYTFWLSRKSYGHDTKALKILCTPSKRKLKSISLKDALYD